MGLRFLHFLLVQKVKRTARFSLFGARRSFGVVSSIEAVVGTTCLVVQMLVVVASEDDRMVVEFTEEDRKVELGFSMGRR